LFLGKYLSIEEFCNEQYLTFIHFKRNELNRKPEDDASSSEKKKHDIKVLDQKWFII